MSAVDLITTLRKAGIRKIEPRPGGNLFIAPKSCLTPELAERIRQAKPDLLALLAEPAVQPEPPSLPIDLTTISDAIARNPRSPFLNDLAIATIARAAIEAQKALTGLPPAARVEALARCREVQDRIVAAIDRRNYESAYDLAARLERLPHEIEELRPQ